MGGCGHSFIRCIAALWRDTHRRNHSLLRRSVLHLFIKEQEARVIVIVSKDKEKGKAERKYM